MWKIIRKYLLITLGSIIYAVAISLILDPNNLAPGGVTGISIILNRLTYVKTGTLIFALNVPILIIGLIKFGWKFIVSTVYSIMVISVASNIFIALPCLTSDPFLASITGACFSALGIGIVFKAGGTTGGMDIIIKLLKIKLPHLKTGSLYMIMDTIIVAGSAFVFKNIDRALYAGVVVFLTSFVLDLVLYGRDGAKFIYIISDEADMITKRLLDELNMGVTYVKGRGAYSGREKDIIMCVVKKPLYPKAEQIIKEEDPMAFMIVSSASEIYGEGYKNLFSEKL